MQQICFIRGEIHNAATLLFSVQAVPVEGYFHELSWVSFYRKYVKDRALDMTQ